MEKENRITRVWHVVKAITAQHVLNGTAQVEAV